ncbi:MAG: hypothetical protein HQ559_16925 [Lentisphaerae bacterium]|nr:hypothetical protein [Lentisphaerota bacterium]
MKKDLYEGRDGTLMLFEFNAVGEPVNAWEMEPTPGALAHDLADTFTFSKDWESRCLELLVSGFEDLEEQALSFLGTVRRGGPDAPLLIAECDGADLVVHVARLGEMGKLYFRGRSFSWPTYSIERT